MIKARRLLLLGAGRRPKWSCFSRLRTLSHYDNYLFFFLVKYPFGQTQKTLFRTGTELSVSNTFYMLNLSDELHSLSIP